MRRFLRAVVYLAIGLAVSTVASGKERTEPAAIFPKALARGDTVMIVAPAKYLDKNRVVLAKKRLEAMGFKVRIPENLFRKKGFLGGSDDERAAELMAAFADPEVKAILPGTGGYGTTRILDKLDYDLIRRNPKIFIGFSDITALHLAINQRTGLVTFHSPNPEFGLGDEKDLSPYAAKWFWRAILATSYATGTEAKRRIGFGPRSPGYLIDTHAGTPPKPGDAQFYEDIPKLTTLHEGKAHGRLTGGNLSVVHSLMGTPYEIESDRRILFLEDVGEAPYRIDRMLNTMRLAGKFDHVAGIILGQFSTRKDEAKWDDDESMDDVLKDYFGRPDVPVLSHFPIGHVRYNTTLPEGAMVELDANVQTLRILENPVKP